MKAHRLRVSVLLAALALVPHGPALAQPSGRPGDAPPKGVQEKADALMQSVTPGQSGVVATNVKTTTATVVMIDSAKRVVTLRLDDGIEVNRAVAPDVDLERVKAGDRVTAKNVDSVAVFVSKSYAATPPKGRNVEVETAKPGEKPGRLTVDTEEITATVAAIEPATRSLTLRNPDGSTRTVQVQSRSKLDGIDVGDQVTLRLTKAVILEVETPK